ncbi:MAG: hypothetical protein NTX50_27800, partial [Candidatus Sumerlaeota bacterium]|nr:hypothetical protein [Candidatus Sumerlaeota bacterium]
MGAGSSVTGAGDILSLALISDDATPALIIEAVAGSGADGAFAPRPGEGGIVRIGSSTVAAFAFAIPNHDHPPALAVFASGCAFSPFVSSGVIASVESTSGFLASPLNLSFLPFASASAFFSLSASILSFFGGAGFATGFAGGGGG